MTTRFTKIAKDDPAGRRWPLFFGAGTDWLRTWQVLEDVRSDSKYAAPPPFYVDCHIVHFCLELFTKSLIDFSISSFNSKEFSHRTLDYMKKYQSVSPIFGRIVGDASLCALIREFEKTVDTRFGETYVQSEKRDIDQIVSLACEIRAEICSKTGLR